MKLYRNNYRQHDDEHRGHTFHSSYRDAEMARKSSKSNGLTVDTEQITVEISKTGLLSALNKYASHPNNG